MAAITFLTRVPIPGRWDFDARDVGKGARWFPLVGTLIGLAYAVAVWALSPFLPALVIGVIVVGLEAVLTGALHLDGLADTADGFGGGHTREDVLRIMRDHAIGSYGGVALVLLSVTEGHGNRWFDRAASAGSLSHLESDAGPLVRRAAELSVALRQTNPTRRQPAWWRSQRLCRPARADNSNALLDARCGSGGWMARNCLLGKRHCLKRSFGSRVSPTDRRRNRGYAWSQHRDV